MIPTMKADLILSRSAYQVGTPVVGTVRIHRAEVNAAVEGEETQQQQHIRDEIVSARLYLAGRAHLGSNARGKVSRWRSTQEINQLKKIYGDHACLTMAKMEEQSSWSQWNGGNGKDKGISGNDIERATKATFPKPIQPPQVTQIEQAERLAVHSSLNHSYLSTHANSDISNNDNTSVDSHSGDQQHQQQPTNDYSHLPTPHENNVICLWMTNVLELLDIPERHLDRKCGQLRSGRGKLHGDMNPYRPLQLPDLDVVRHVLKEMEKNNDNAAVAQTNKNALKECKGEESLSCKGDSIPLGNVENGKGKAEQGQLKTEDGEKALAATTNTTSSPEQSAWERIVASANPDNATFQSDDEALKDDDDDDVPLEQKQLALSFRADLPPDVPPTMSAECVKYFYSAVLVVTTTSGELLVTQCPFAVLTSNSQHSSHKQTHQTSSTRVHIGDLHAIAHSAGLPAYISATEASDATPTQLTVVTNPPACDIVSRRTAEQRTSSHRIVDGNGCFCGLMTLIGFGGPLLPGTRLGIRLRFPIYDDDEMANGAGIIPCYRVCCGLVGEEYAIFEGSSSTSKAGTTANSQSGKKRVKTRSYVFDSAYEAVEFGYTEDISMGLVLPLDCPVTVKTDLVEVTVMLKVEFTVSRTAITSEASNEGGEGGGQGEFSAIRLDLPCEVVHVDGGSNGYSDGGEEDEKRVSSIRTMQQFWKNDENETVGDGFDDTDVQSDLKMLSLRMIELM